MNDIFDPKFSYKIDFDLIEQHKRDLLKFSKITEYDIQNIWIEKGEKSLDDFSTLKYNYDIPLYQKMIFRFRNSLNSPFGLCKGCDPCNATILVSCFGLPYDIRIVEFFGWIRFSLNDYKLREFLSGFQDWHNYKKNEIYLYFSLSESKKIKMIDMYNQYLC